MVYALLDSEQRTIVTMDSVSRITMDEMPVNGYYRITAKLKDGDTVLLGQYADQKLAEGMLYTCLVYEDDDYFVFPKEEEVVTRTVDEEKTSENLKELMDFFDSQQDGE